MRFGRRVVVWSLAVCAGPSVATAAGTKEDSGWVAVTYASAALRGRLYAAGGREARHPGVVLQRDVGVAAEALADEARALAGAGAVVLTPDWALDGASDDAALWRRAADDEGRAIDFLLSRSDVDPQRLVFVGVGFGASVGAIVAATDARVRALVLVEPEGDPRAGSYSSLRWRFGLEHVQAPAPSERLRQAPSHAPLLVQLGSAERAMSDEDLAAWTDSVAVGDRIAWYASSRGPDALRDRVAFVRDKTRGV
jgi:dienelactone hydrolase